MADDATLDAGDLRGPRGRAGLIDAVGAAQPGASADTWR